MDIRILSLFSAFLVLLVNVDARNVIMFQDVGKSTNDGIASSLQWLERVGSVIVSKEGLSPEFICLSCLEVSRSVEKVLLDPVLPEKIGLFANDACHILPADLRVKCVEMLELYTNKAILFLQVYFSEKNLCNSTGLCPENAYTLPMLSLSKDQLFSVVHLVRDLTTENGANSRLLTKQQMLQPVIQRLTDKMVSDNSCTACRSAMDDLRKDLADPEMKMKVIRILYEACENVENHAKQCKRMVLEYGPIILSNLEKYLSKNDLCYMVHICEASAPHTFEIMDGFDSLLLSVSSGDGIISK